MSVGKFSQINKDICCYIEFFLLLPSFLVVFAMCLTYLCSFLGYFLILFFHLLHYIYDFDPYRNVDAGLL